MGIHLSITSTVLPLFTMLFQKFVVSFTQFIYFVQTKIQILLYSIILSGGQFLGGQLSGGQLSGSIVGGSIVGGSIVGGRLSGGQLSGVNCRGINCRPPVFSYDCAFICKTVEIVEYFENKLAHNNRSQ